MNTDITKQIIHLIFLISKRIAESLLPGTNALLLSSKRDIPPTGWDCLRFHRI